MCVSVVNPVSGLESNRISLTSSLVNSSSLAIIFSIVQGDHTMYQLVGTILINQPLSSSCQFTSQPDYALGIFDILVSINIDTSTYMYNHGVQIASGVTALPALSLRPYCNIGRDTQLPKSSMMSIIKYSTFIGAVRLFSYDPMAYDTRFYPQLFLLPNNTMSQSFSASSSSPVNMDFSDAIFTPISDITSSIFRNGAKWVANITLASISANDAASPSSTVANPSDLQTTNSDVIPPLSDVTTSTASPNDPSLNLFQGAALLKNGGYINMGTTMFGGTSLTIRAQFSLFNLVNDSTIFDLGNRLTSPLDNVRLSMGNLSNDSSTADLILTVNQNGFACAPKSFNSTVMVYNTLCTFVVAGALHASLTKVNDVIIVFTLGLTKIYLDAVFVASTTSLWFPMAVVRQYSFIGYSYGCTWCASLSMLIYSFSITPKALSDVDISVLNPSLSSVYTYSFIDPPTLQSSASLYPIYNSSYSMWNANPFNLGSNPNDIIDDTSVDDVNPTPTPGLLFVNGDVNVIHDTYVNNSNYVVYLEDQLANYMKLESQIKYNMTLQQQYNSTVNLTVHVNSTQSSNSTIGMNLT